MCLGNRCGPGLAPRSHHKLAHAAMMAGREQGDASVFEGVRCAVGLASRASPLVLAAALCGCSSFDTSSSWFVKPLRLYGSNLGYTYTQFDDAKMDRPITANDLVDASGACPRYVVPSPPPAAGAAPAAGPTDAASLLGAGVAIGMSECDIVARLGQPTAVNVGRGPGGDRAVGVDLQQRSATRGLSFRRRPTYGNGPRRSAASAGSRAGEEKNGQKEAGQNQETAEARRQHLSGVRAANLQALERRRPPIIQLAQWPVVLSFENDE